MSNMIDGFRELAEIIVKETKGNDTDLDAIEIINELLENNYSEIVDTTKVSG